MNYKIIILLILSIGFFSCESNVKKSLKPNETENIEKTVSEPKPEIKIKNEFRDTISVDYLKNKKLLDILKVLPESTMRSWEWKKVDREKTVSFIEKNNFIIDTTEMYNNIKYIQPNTIGIQVVDGFWTLSIYQFEENDFFIVTNDIVGDGNDIQTFNFKNNELTPTKMINWFNDFDSKLLLKNSTECIELLEDNQLTFEYDFRDKNMIKISSWLLNKNESKGCLKGNSINYKLNKSNKTFDITIIYWKNNETE
ncbi:hypothetical protein [Polaribacter atrinae]|uniref:Lipoprotein n=1 Tax=Polaribacter atrinae TaxID=1333662 RepID=A0A176TA48_9FLAO|nr:hypothetical protein [Polaribacter atrinae]OAD44551.1 hypothetical protein LPB303_12005 [Polaribacter atrinae]